MITAGENLVDVLDALHTSGPDAFHPLRGNSPDVRAEAFVQWFADRIAEAGGIPSNSVVRRTAVRCARNILENPEIRSVITRADSTVDLRLDSELFCEIYRLFFTQLVGEFIRSIITAKIDLWVPELRTIDSKILEWVGGMVVELIPDPCEERRRREGEGSLANLARDLVAETVRRVLGLPDEK